MYMEKVNVNKDILMIKDFISEQEANILLDLAKFATDEQWEVYNNTERDEYNEWENRILSIRLIPQLNIKYDHLLNTIFNRVKSEINEYLENYDYEYTDMASIYRARKGDFMNPHHDAGLGPKYKYGVVLYLNGDYAGGEIYYPKQGIEIKPLARSLVLHPANQIYRHGVKEVTLGTRYSMTTFIRLK